MKRKQYEVYAVAWHDTITGPGRSSGIGHELVDLVTNNGIDLHLAIEHVERQAQLEWLSEQPRRITLEIKVTEVEL
ncbi:MAG: hypothetical protein JWQ32_2056 [Marmoricola sp.]|nr:hypothetical protein [Marmoricola sp.]